MPKSKLPRKTLPAKSLLDKLFRYDPESGKLYNRVTRPGTPAGIEAGSTKKAGRQVNIDGKSYMVTKIIWKMVYDESVYSKIFHLDFDNLNNRLDNLAKTSGRRKDKNRDVYDPLYLPPKEQLDRLFEYQPDTGLLIRKTRTSGRTRAGQIAGTKRKDDGYLILAIDYQNYFVHRLIWKMVTGEDPVEIDHINGVTDDNRLENLRAVTRSDNFKNRRLSEVNTTGVMGVTWNAKRGKWRVRAFNDQREVHIGEYDNFSDAVAARKAAEKLYGYHPNHGRVMA